MPIGIRVGLRSTENQKRSICLESDISGGRVVMVLAPRCIVSHIQSLRRPTPVVRNTLSAHGLKRRELVDAALEPNKKA